MDERAPKNDTESVPNQNHEPSAGLIDTLIFGLSLPERSARSVTAVVAGFANETAARIIPAAFRTSKSYNVFIQQSLDFVMHDVGRVTKEEVDETSNAEITLARRAVGGMLDFAGMATIHLSPLTILAVVSDVAYGSSTYLRQLGDELKRQGVIDQESTIDHVSDLLDALQSTSQQSSDVMNAPPMNLQGLRETIESTRDSINKIDVTSVIPEHEIKRLWQDMEEVAGESNASIFDVAATVTMYSMNRLSLVTKGALSTVTVAGNLLDQHILQHYADGLSEIQVKGLWTTLSESSEPYLDAIWNNFDHQQSTITEDLLSGKLIGEAWQGLTGWFKQAPEENKE